MQGAQARPVNVVTRLPIVGVMGSSAAEHADLAVPLGRWLGAQSVHLLTGGGGGVMEAVSRAFCEVPGRRGHSIGIIPRAEAAPGPGAGGCPDAPAEPGRETRYGYPNPWIEIAIFTHLPLSGPRGTEPMSRNHINILTADVIVALPGSAGTASEVALARRYGRPLIAYLRDRREIPGLAEDIAMTSDLGTVTRFILAHMGPPPGGTA